jgi:hypothetical protein
MIQSASGDLSSSLRHAGGIATVGTMRERSVRKRSAQRLTPNARNTISIWVLYDMSIMQACTRSTTPKVPVACAKLSFLLGFCHRGHLWCGHDMFVTVTPWFITEPLF